MARTVKALAAEADNLSSIPRTYVVEERTHLPKLSFDFHTHTPIPHNTTNNVDQQSDPTNVPRRIKIKCPNKCPVIHKLCTKMDAF